MQQTKGRSGTHWQYDQISCFRRSKTRQWQKDYRTEGI